VRQDEEDSEQEGSCQGGCLLERFQQGGKGKSWQDMPQMKELKELTLLVSDEERKGRYGRVAMDRKDDLLLYLPILFCRVCVVSISW
jgi:hypothetical protein